VAIAEEQLASFLAGQFAGRATQSCIGVDLLFDPGSMERVLLLRSWDNGLGSFDPAMASQFTNDVLGVIQNDATTKPTGAYRYVVSCRRFAGGRALHTVTYSHESSKTRCFSDDDIVAIDLILIDLDQRGVLVRRDALDALVPDPERRADLIGFAEMLRQYRHRLGTRAD
jgi:hypothetical protein